LKLDQQAGTNHFFDKVYATTIYIRNILLMRSCWSWK